METPKYHGRIIVGIMLILVGLVFVSRNYNVIFIPDDFLNWEYFFILGGVLFLILSRNKTAGVVLIAIGLFNLIPELWPLIFVLLGIYFISGRIHFKHGHFDSPIAEHTQTQPQNGSNYIESISIFGGLEKVVHSANFKGGSIISIFGGSEINLTNCKLAEGENVIEITALFGGSTLIIPFDWKVELDVLPIFGGFGDKRRKDPNKAIQEGRSLVIKGLVLFGGGEIKN